jgi:predicted RNA-binding Zn ribbon-like protein
MTKPAPRSQPEFELSGGMLCLDFANTVSQRKVADRRRDNLPSYNDLLSFARASGVISPQFAHEILILSRVRAKERAGVFEAAIGLREAIYRVFAAIANSRAADRKDVKPIEEFATEAMRHRHLASAGREYRWDWNRDKQDALAYILWPIAESAAELLTSERVKKVRECEAPTCAWLFLDESRNHSRRWCDMSICGNRQKARRHYKRVVSG